MLLDSSDVWMVVGALYMKGGYACMRVPVGRLLMGLRLGDPRQVDHINGDHLDCRSVNLRICTPEQNRYNRKGWGGSGYKGVYKHGNRWICAVWHMGKKFYLGTYRTPQEAARRYDKEAILRFGQYARLNYPVDYETETRRPHDAVYLAAGNGGKRILIDAGHVDVIRGSVCCSGRSTSLTTSLHRWVLGMRNGDGFEVDHVNRNKLDCTRDNLRVVTRQQNAMNVSLRSDNKSGYKGVCWNSRLKKWHASISYNHAKVSLGYFDRPEDAARAYDKKAHEYSGDFAYLNLHEEWR